MVEPRDEVFARLAGDLIESGYRVVRALTVTGAIKACVKYRPVLVIASLSLPGKAAWRMAPKLAMIDAKTRVWLYGHFIATHDYAMADFLGIEHLIECSGDLFRLSLQVRESLIDDRGTMMDRHGCQRI